MKKGTKWNVDAKTNKKGRCLFPDFTAGALSGAS